MSVDKDSKIIKHKRGWKTGADDNEETDQEDIDDFADGIDTSILSDQEDEDIVDPYDDFIEDDDINVQSKTNQPLGNVLFIKIIKPDGKGLLLELMQDMVQNTLL